MPRQLGARQACQFTIEENRRAIAALKSKGERFGAVSGQGSGEPQNCKSRRRKYLLIDCRLHMMNPIQIPQTNGGRSEGCAWTGLFERWLEQACVSRVSFVAFE